jgi:RNA 3'-terminal phosphate cyclase (ATP)
MAASASASSASVEELVIDGSEGEGGGQVLRMSLALSVISQRPFKLERIRGKRPKPGLKAQHLAGVRTVGRMFGCALGGDELNSECLTVTPGSAAIVSPTLSVDVGTAGSCSLVAQATLPGLVLAPGPWVEPGVRSLTVRGGTDVAMAPPTDTLSLALFPLLERMGVRLRAAAARRGFFPKGGGSVEYVGEVLAPGAKIRPITLVKRGEVTHVLVRVMFGGSMSEDVARDLGFAAARHAGCPPSALEPFRRRKDAPASRGGKRGGKGRGRGDTVALESSPPKECTTTVAEASGTVASNVAGPAQWRCELVGPCSASGSGAVVSICATSEGGGVLCRSYPLDRSDSPASKGQEVARKFLAELAHGGCVDEYTLDQLVVWTALADGESRVCCGPPSLHATTAVDIVKRFFPAIEIGFHHDAEADRWEYRAVGIRYAHSF